MHLCASQMMQNIFHRKAKRRKTTYYCIWIIFAVIFDYAKNYYILKLIQLEHFNTIGSGLRWQGFRPAFEGTFQNKIILYYLLKDLSWLPQDPFLLEIKTFIFGAEYLTLERPPNGEIYKQNIISDSDFKEIHGVIHNGGLMEPLKFKGKDCLVVYGTNVSKSISIYCVNFGVENNILELYMETEIKKEDAKQVLALSESHIAILVENAVEIWNISSGLEPYQVWKTINKARMMAVIKIDGTTYLAVVSENSNDNLLSATVLIFSCHGADFTYRQTLDLDVDPQQIAFSFLKLSNDLLLYVRTNTPHRPLLIYQLRGVMEFQLICGPKTILETAHHMQILDLKSSNKQFIVLFGVQGIYFVDFKFKTYISKDLADI